MVAELKKMMTDKAPESKLLFQGLNTVTVAAATQQMHAPGHLFRHDVLLVESSKDRDTLSIEHFRKSAQDEF